MKNRSLPRGILAPCILGKITTFRRKLLTYLEFEKHNKISNLQVKWLALMFLSGRYRVQNWAQIPAITTSVFLDSLSSSRTAAQIKPRLLPWNILPNFILKTKTARYSAKLVNLRHSKWYHISEDSNLKRVTLELKHWNPPHSIITWLMYWFSFVSLFRWSLNWIITTLITSIYHQSYLLQTTGW